MEVNQKSKETLNIKKKKSILKFSLTSKPDNNNNSKINEDNKKKVKKKVKMKINNEDKIMNISNLSKEFFKDDICNKKRSYSINYKKHFNFVPILKPHKSNITPTPFSLYKSKSISTINFIGESKKNNQITTNNQINTANSNFALFFNKSLYSSSSDSDSSNEDQKNKKNVKNHKKLCAINELIRKGTKAGTHKANMNDMINEKETEKSNIFCLRQKLMNIKNNILLREVFNNVKSFECLLEKKYSKIILELKKKYRIIENEDENLKMSDQKKKVKNSFSLSLKKYGSSIFDVLKSLSCRNSKNEV